MKSMAKPSPDGFRTMLKRARQQARKAGMKKADVAKATRKVRKGD